MGVLLTAVGSVRADDKIKGDPLETVKLLYGTAAYEEALQALLQVDDVAVADQLDEYRVLCLLALQRDAEAEHAMERLVARHPISLDGLNDQPPKFTPYRCGPARARIGEQRVPFSAGTSTQDTRQRTGSSSKHSNCSKC